MAPSTEGVQRRAVLSHKDSNPEGRQNVLGRPRSWCGQGGSCDGRVEEWVTILRDDWADPAGHRSV